VSIVLLHQSNVTAAHRGRVVKRAWVPTLTETKDTLDQLARIVAIERESGFAEGKAKGEAEAKLIWDQKLISLAADVAKEQNILRAKSAALAVEIVRKLAPTLGAAQLVPALTECIARDLVPGNKIEIYVHPEALIETRARVAGLDTPIDVIGDEQAELFQCRIETAHGRIDGSLNIQLDALDATFAANAKMEQSAS
jgi:type III secretion protein L